MQEVIKNAVVTRVLTEERGPNANTSYVCFNRQQAPGEFWLPIAKNLSKELPPGTRVSLTTTIEIEDDQGGGQGGERKR